MDAAALATAQLCEAARSGDYDGLRMLVRGVDAASLDGLETSSGRSPLFWATHEGHGECVAALLEAGASPHVLARDRQTVLHPCCWFGRMELLQVFVGLGVDVNAADGYSQTPLHYAAWKGHADLCRFLVREGAELHLRSTAPSSRGWTPLHFASAYSRADVYVELVCCGAGLIGADDGCTPADLFREGFRERVFEYSQTIEDPHDERTAVARRAPADRLAPEAAQAQEVEASNAQNQVLEGSVAQELRAAEAEAPSGNLDDEWISVGGPSRAFPDDTACIVCMDGEREYALVPCGHRCLCAECRSGLESAADKRCPICRTPFTMAMKIFD